MTTNDAAERLRAHMTEADVEYMDPLLDAALAAEYQRGYRQALVDEIGELATDARLDAEAERYDANAPDEVERAHLYGLPDAEAER